MFFLFCPSLGKKKKGETCLNRYLNLSPRFSGALAVEQCKKKTKKNRVSV